jgi:nitrate reductase NapE component
MKRKYIFDIILLAVLIPLLSVSAIVGAYKFYIYWGKDVLEYFGILN